VPCSSGRACCSCRPLVRRVDSQGAEGFGLGEWEQELPRREGCAMHALGAPAQVRRWWREEGLQLANGCMTRLALIWPGCGNRQLEAEVQDEVNETS